MEDRFIAKVNIATHSASRGGCASVVNELVGASLGKQGYRGRIVSGADECRSTNTGLRQPSKSRDNDQRGGVGAIGFFQEWAKPQALREDCTTKFVHTPNRSGLFSATTWADRPRSSGFWYCSRRTRAVFIHICGIDHLSHLAVKAPLNLRSVNCR